MNHVKRVRFVSAVVAAAIFAAPVAASAVTLAGTVDAASAVTAAGAADATSTITASEAADAPSAAVGDPVEVTPNPAPVVVVRSYATSPARVLVGAEFDLTLTIYNATARRADNVVVSLGQAVGSSAAAAGGGLTVLGTGNAKYFGTLRGEREGSVSFDVMVSPGTAPGAYTVPVTVSFEFEGIRQELAYTIGVIVERDATLSVVTAELPQTVIQGETFDASFEVANTSGFALSGVTLSVEASGAAVMDGSYFVGTMAADATEGLDVTITPETTGTLDVVIQVTYRDDFGVEQTFSETREVTVEAMPAEEVPVDGETPDGETASENWFVAFIKALFGLGS